MPLLDVIVGYDCNLYCDYCTISPQMRERSLSASAIASAMRQGRRAGFDRVSFTGGEPTIFPGLLALVKEARRLGFVDVKVQTNGLLLAEPKNVDRLLDAGVDRVHVSIHSHRPEHYEQLVRRTGTFDAMAAALADLARRDVELVADVILKHDTHACLRAALRWLHGRGVRRADLWFVSLTDHNRDNLLSMPRMTEVMPSVHEGLSWARQHDLRVRSLHIPRCLLGDASEHAFDPAAQGVRVVTPDATFDLQRSKLTGHVLVPSCAGCEYAAICPGIREDYLERFGDDEFAVARGATVGQIPPRRGLPVVS